MAKKTRKQRKASGEKRTAKKTMKQAEVIKPTPAVPHDQPPTEAPKQKIKWSYVVIAVLLVIGSIYMIWWSIRPRTTVTPPVNTNGSTLKVSNDSSSTLTPTNGANLQGSSISGQNSSGQTGGNAGASSLQPSANAPTCAEGQQYSLATNSCQ